MHKADDPRARVITLAALCKVYEATEWPLLERLIAILQFDTRVWLRQHPEHVRPFCDAYYEERKEIAKLACEMADMADMAEADAEWYPHDGIAHILKRRYEPRAAQEKRWRDAGFSTIDSGDLLKDWPEDKIRELDEQIAERNRQVAEEKALGLDQDRRLNYAFWLPDREEMGGEFFVGIPKRYAWRMDRIQDYRFAGGRFPTQDFMVYFNELLEMRVISEADHMNLIKWIAYESRPKVQRDAAKASAACPPITDSPKIRQAMKLLTDFDVEEDELDDCDQMSVVLSRREAETVLARLEHAGDESAAFQQLLNQLRQSLESGEPELATRLRKWYWSPRK